MAKTNMCLHDYCQRHDVDPVDLLSYVLHMLQKSHMKHVGYHRKQGTDGTVFLEIETLLNSMTIRPNPPSMLAILGMMTEMQHLQDTIAVKHGTMQGTPDRKINKRIRMANALREILKDCMNEEIEVMPEMQLDDQFCIEE